MDATTNASNLPRWISDVNELALGWYTVIRRPELVNPPTAQLTLGTGGAAVRIDPNLLIVGALAVVAVIWIVNQ
jgi:hypothetical protein